MKKIFIFAACFLPFVSCTENDPAPVKPDITNEDYFPNTSGSNWHYKGVLSTSMTLTGETIELDGKDYFKIESSNSANPSFLSKKNGEYYLRGFILGTANQNLLVLKDNVQKGASWKQQLTVNKLENTFTFVIAEKGITETINGVTFTDVITVEMDQSFAYNGDQLPLSQLKFYFAKGVGLIKLDTKYHTLTGLEGLNGSSVLESYAVN